MRLTGLATQFSLEPPHDSGFQLMLAATPEDVEVVQGSSMPSMSMWLGVVGGIGVILAAWWVRERRLADQRRSMRAFHALSEEIISAASPVEIAEKLAGALPNVSQATRRALVCVRSPGQSAGTGRDGGGAGPDGRAA